MELVVTIPKTAENEYATVDPIVVRTLRTLSAERTSSGNGETLSQVEPGGLQGRGVSPILQLDILPTFHGTVVLHKFNKVDIPHSTFSRQLFFITTV